MPVAAVHGALGVNVRWRANTETNLAGYHIYWGSTSGVYTNRITVDKTAVRARVEPLMPGQRYYLAMTAFNTANQESLPSQELVYQPSNAPPEISLVTDQSLSEDIPSDVIAFSVSDLETPAGQLQVTARSSNPTLIPDQYVLLSGTGAQRNMVIVPHLDQSGSADITVEVRDPQGASSSTTFRASVDPMNDRPVILPIMTQRVDEDGLGRVPFYVLDADSDADLIWMMPLTTDTTLIPYETLAITGGGNSRVLTFRPAKDAHGSCKIELYALDDQEAYVMTEFWVVVRPVNDPPVATVTNLVLNEDTPGAAVITVSDVDDPPESLTVSASSSNPLLATTETVAWGGVPDRRTLVVSPKPDQFGSCPVSLVIRDPQGAASTNSFTVTVNGVNDPPNLASIPSFSIDQGTGPLAVPLSGINAGPSNEIQTLVVTAESDQPWIIPVPQVNYVSPNATGSLLIAALPNTNGSAVITVSVSDGQATNAVTRQTFTVSLDGFNNPPVVYLPANLVQLRLPSPGRITFTVQDPDTPVERLVVGGYSSDQLLLPNANLAFAGTGTQRTLTITPVLGRTGLATVTVVVSDGDATVTASFWVLVAAAGT